MVTPLVFVIERSALGVSVSVSVALLLAASASTTPPGAEIVAVLTSEPVAVASTVAVMVYVADAPTGRLTVVARSPVPFGSPQTAPDVAAQLQVAPVSAAGSVSATTASVTADGPALATPTV